MMDGGDAESFRPHFICCQVKRRWRPMERDKDAWTVLGRLLLWPMNRELGEGDKCVPLDILSHARARRRARHCYYADKMLTCGSGFSVRSNSFSSTLCDISGNQRRSRSASERRGGGGGGQTGGLVSGRWGGVIIRTKSPRDVTALNRCCSVCDCASQTGICSHPPRSRCIFLTRVKHSEVCFLPLRPEGFQQHSSLTASEYKERETPQEHVVVSWKVLSHRVRD